MPTKPQLPRPNTYIKIRDIEQLKLLCEYKNDEVCHDDDYSTIREIADFQDKYKYFVWHNDGKGCVRYVTDGTQELTDDSFLYPTKPMKEKKQKQEDIRIKHGSGNPELHISKVSIDYTQEADSDSNEVCQTLTIETDDVGGGIFYRIRTKEFTFDNPKEIENILLDFMKRVKS